MQQAIARRTTTQNWPAYNRAQTTEKHKFQEILYALCSLIEEPPLKSDKGGRPPLPVKDRIFSAVFKVYSMFSGRRFTSDLMEAKLRGYLTKQPHYNSIFRYLESEELTPYLKALIEESSLPLKSLEEDFAVDSSGFSTGLYQKWVDAKWNKVRDAIGNPKPINKRDWIKAHIMVGVKTNVVTSCTITDGHAGDSPQFKFLVRATSENFAMKTVVADKAYSSRKNLRLVASHAATPYIDFKDNSKPNPKDSLWSKMWNVYDSNKEWFYSHYHKRSNVETTFSMIKAKFGERLRSKTTVAQHNELLCKILCHNICCLIQSMYEFGVDVDFS